AGSVTMPPITPPSPIVAPSRKTERLYVGTSSAAGSGAASSATSTATVPGGGGACAGSRTPRVRSSTQRKPNTSARAAPITTPHQLTTNPTRRQTTPTANPTGHRLGAGTCGLSSCELTLETLRHSIAPSFGVSKTYRASQTAPARGILTIPRLRASGEPVLGPAPVDERLHLLAHADRLGPGAGALVRPLRGGVEADLAAVAGQQRGVVELVDRPLGELDVPLGVDVGAEVEEDLLVVVHVHVLVHDD